MVARFQKYRKTDMVIEAFADLVKGYPSARLLLLGRSSQMIESVHEPAKALGVSDKVITPGYVMDRYRDALLSMDVFVFMMPGSDGTARALREAQTLGLPVVALDVGMIPELVDDGRTGLLIEQTPEDLKRALGRLFEDEAFRKELGENARNEALRRYDPRRQAEQTLSFYTQLAGDDDKN
jgi:glycosyltransferase involved in cell wall biosynthesis